MAVLINLCLALGIMQRKGGAYAERSAVGEPDGDVGEDGEDPVGGRGAEGQVVGDFVDGEEEVLVRGRADNVGGQGEGEGQHGGVAERDGAGQLQSDDAEDVVLGQGFGAAELRDLVCVSCIVTAGENGPLTSG